MDDCSSGTRTAPTNRELLAANLVVFAGMPRTASTSLFHILGQHPGIFRPWRKEVGYFLFNHHRGEEWYLDVYSGAAPGQRCIDVTPEYFFSPQAARRIAAFGEGVRVIIGVRRPASFAESLYAEYGKRYRMPPLETFVDRYAYSRGSAEIEFSLASGVIRAMLDLYRREIAAGVLFYDFSAFQAGPLAVLQAIEAFMGLDAYFTPETFRNVHTNSRDRDNRRWLTQLLSAEPLIAGVSRLLPAAAMRAIARRVYAGGGTKRDMPPPEPPPSLWLRDTFLEDERFIEGLFAGRPVHVAQGSSAISQR